MENFTMEELDSHNLKTLINFSVNKDSKARHYVPPDVMQHREQPLLSILDKNVEP